MAKVTHDNFDFLIPDDVQVQYTQLVELVLHTESMDNNEKQYWFDILPSMTDEQVDRLFDILETERRKLEEIEVKYQNELKTLNEKHLIEWQEYQVKSTKKKIEKQEWAEKTANKEEAEVLLEDL